MFVEGNVSLSGRWYAASKLAHVIKTVGKMDIQGENRGEKQRYVFAGTLHQLRSRD